MSIDLHGVAFKPVDNNSYRVVPDIEGFTFEKTTTFKEGIKTYHYRYIICKILTFFGIAREVIAENGVFYLSNKSVVNWLNGNSQNATVKDTAEKIKRCFESVIKEEAIPEIPRPDSLENVPLGIMQTKAKIKSLRKKIYKLDQLVLNNPELKAIVEEALKSHVFIAKRDMRSSIKDLDPSNPIDRLCLLRFKEIDLRYSLKERIIFIRSNKAVYNAFQKYMNEAHSYDKNEKFTPVLLNAIVEIHAKS